MKRMPLSTLSALCLAIVFCSFTALSIVYYPYPWSPATTFLSDFGNLSMSPAGALIYNAGCIMTAVAAVAFYVGMDDWNGGALLGIGRIFGVSSGVALAMIGVFSEDFPPQHRFWSYFFFVINFFAILLTNVSLMHKESYGKSTTITGFSLSAVTLVSFLFWGGAPSVEWFTVIASIAFSLLVGYDTYRKRAKVGNPL
jgi:hypothetical membrane protein